MTTSVTVRLSDEHIRWLKSGGRTATEAIRDALDRAINEDSYRQAQKVLLRLPLDTEDDWGDPQEFMLQARPDEG